MKAIFFGSIGSLVETSEMQRDAFNRAFKAFNLSWYWDQKTYRTLIEASGGRRRIVEYAEAKGNNVDANAIHRMKTELFHERLKNGELEFRDGVLDVLHFAADQSLTTGFISATEKRTVDLIATSLRAQTDIAFDLVTSRAQKYAEKPSPELYLHALDVLRLQTSSVIAIEDNQSGLDAAQAAGLTTISFAGINTPNIKGASYDAIDNDGLLALIKSICRSEEQSHK